ncbi:guanyl-nucleotide exchange factor [Apiospora marii]|uniref:Guanyl-nucleotide exchange factor n=1 Tax=Apiospora marii TaxID=335849 RepID=A0ABR1RZE1_9PEZI
MVSTKEPLPTDDGDTGDSALQETTLEPIQEETDPAAIRTRTERCQALFETCQRHFISDEDDWLDKMSAAFSWWSLGIGAAKSGHSSLDRRVQSRDDVKDLIISLLDSLKTSLENCLELSTNRNEVQEGQGNPFDMDGQRYYIRTNIQYLSKISASIRKSGTKFRHQRADRLLEHRAPKLEEFRRYMFWIILVGPSKMQLLNSLLQRHTLTGDITWKKAWITLKAYFTDEQRLSPVQKRLIHANLVRRNRFDIYFRTCRQKTGSNEDTSVPGTVPDPTKHTAVTPKPNATNSEDPIPDQARRHDPGVQMQPTPSQAAKSVDRTMLSSQPATDIGSIVMPRRPTTQGARTVSTKFSRGALKQDYPKCPCPEGKSFWCPFCAQPLDASYSNRKKDKRWRGHVAEDLSPYVCVYEDCDSPDAMYLSTDQWKAHLAKSHSASRWICDSCWLDSDNPSEFEFDAEKAWSDHLAAEHEGEYEEEDLEDFAEASCRSVIPPVSCPLCHGNAPSSKPDADEHIAEHLHSFALQALPWETVGTDEDEITRGSAGSGVQSPLCSASDDESEGLEEREGYHPVSLWKLRLALIRQHADRLHSRLSSSGSRWDVIDELQLVFDDDIIMSRGNDSYREDILHEANVRLERIIHILERLLVLFDVADSQDFQTDTQDTTLDLHDIQNDMQDTGLSLSEELSGFQMLAEIAGKSSYEASRAPSESSSEGFDSEMSCSRNLYRTGYPRMAVLIALATGGLGFIVPTVSLHHRFDIKGTMQVFAADPSTRDPNEYHEGPGAPSSSPNRLIQLFNQHWQAAFSTMPEFPRYARMLQQSSAVFMPIPRHQIFETPAEYLERIKAYPDQSKVTATLSTHPDPFMTTTLKMYMSKFDFSEEPIDVSLRKFLIESEIGMESDTIDRVLKAFANRYHRCNPNIYRSSDTAYFFAVSLLILHMNTFDQETAKLIPGLTYEVAYRMTADDYIKATRGKGVCEDILRYFYDNLTHIPIIGVNGLRTEEVVNAESQPKVQEIAEPTTRICGIHYPTTLARILSGGTSCIPRLISDGLGKINYSTNPYNWFNGLHHLSTYSQNTVNAFCMPSSEFEEDYDRNERVIKCGILMIYPSLQGPPGWILRYLVLTEVTLYICREPPRGGQPLMVPGGPVLKCYESRIGSLRDGDLVMPLEQVVALTEKSYTDHEHAFLVAQQSCDLETRFVAEEDDDMQDWMTKINYAAAFHTAGFLECHSLEKSYSERERRHRELRQHVKSLETPRTPIDDRMISEARHFDILMPLKWSTRDRVLVAASKIRRRIAQRYIEERRVECHLEILSGHLQRDDVAGTSD